MRHEEANEATIGRLRNVNFDWVGKHEILVLKQAKVIYNPKANETHENILKKNNGPK